MFKPSPKAADNVLARKALEEIERIEREAQHRKLEQVDSLIKAREAITERIRELEHQLVQLNATIAKVTGKAAPAERRQRRDLSEDRERVARWMTGRSGQKFGAGDLVREFPELDGTPISIFLKPLIEDGKIKTDASEGIRRMKYYVEG
jgi:hypothetical protein